MSHHNTGFREGKHFQSANSRKRMEGVSKGRIRSETFHTEDRYS